AKELGRQRRQPIALTVRPAIFNRDGAAFGVAHFVQPLPECGRGLRGPLGRGWVEKSDRRGRRLLPARRERPRGSRAAKQRDELPAFHLTEWHSVPRQSPSSPASPAIT